MRTITHPLTGARMRVRTYPRKVRIAVPGGYFTIMQHWPWGKATMQAQRRMARACFGPSGKYHFHLGLPKGCS